ncbi:peroxisomal leader peptide-processing protease [Sabethes cyaneus]|uniref:peroxisomal leader peptide-processing protease n=1 Tax=Sabethes cyaneus TaxID=53552 RepID=UPI00237E666E|nr:peroxisomal leader peptide-processing protease [Sabethes cyaneus]
MKKWFPNHGIIYCRTGFSKSSAIIFPNGLILTSGLVLLQATNSTDALCKIPDEALIQLEDHPELYQLRDLDFGVITENSKNELTEFKAQVAFIVYSKSIEATIRNFSSLKFLVDGRYKNVAEYSKYFSTFLLLQKSGTKISAVQMKHSFWYLMNSTSCQLNLLEEITCITTPFGNEHFINTVSYGHVANIFGSNNCLALLNVQTAFGCEGGGVYDRKLNLRSILLGSCFNNQNDNVNFPLAANITEIFLALFNRNLQHNPEEYDAAKIIESVCMIDSVNCWGTGCIFRMENYPLVITCSHVVKSDNINCFVKGCELQLNLLYKNPVYDSAYDIAILSVADSSDLQKIQPCRLAKYLPKVGQKVYSVGFPLFKTVDSNERFKPSIFCGRITNYTKGVLITDCPVQAGQSGGPIYDTKGHLLAVMVSNFKSSIDNKVYPHHNMCVPICDIIPAIQKYVKTKDITALKGLEANRTIIDKWKLQNLKIRNKL